MKRFNDYTILRHFLSGSLEVVVFAKRNRKSFNRKIEKQ
ncbi:hypothetical protein CRYO30217_02843 [Parvicella tangerina]|uniref:Uncharacterized protein n=1 Tax=Parvicella tangerina TaxID=2829795 RepID=A0A916JPH2_9FLAO|nr:hypothetical protein CRYO30217_02843 [Parvicella tangerina]